MVQRKSVVIASVLAAAGLVALGCEDKKPAPAPKSNAPVNKAPTTPPPAPTGATGAPGAPASTGGTK